MDKNLLEKGTTILSKSNLGFTGATNAPGCSQRINRAFLDSIHLEMRVIDAVRATPRTAFYGHVFSSPVMVAALSNLDAIRTNGMEETAKGAAAAGVPMWVGVGSEDELERIVDTGVKTIKIVKPYLDDELVLKKIAHAEKCGSLAIGMDVSFAFGMKNGFMPAPMGPKSMDDIKRYAASTNLPFILKGVLSEQDAAKAMEAGAAGIMVSHQGGTVLDYAVPPTRILPRIACAVKKRIPIFVDGGIAGGTDVFKALALGANGVGIGRMIMVALAAGGSEGVRDFLEHTATDLKRVMSLTGSSDTSSIHPGVLWRQCSTECLAFVRAGRDNASGPAYV